MQAFHRAVLCVSVILAASGQLRAGWFESKDDPALAGAVVETFNTAALGEYLVKYDPPLFLDDVTVTGSVNTDTTSFIILDGDGFGDLVPPNPTGDRILSGNSTTLLTFDFVAPVRAFGIVVSPILQQVNKMTAYDEDGMKIDEVTLWNPSFDWFYGFSSETANIARVTVTNIAAQSIFLDDLHYVKAVPEPSSFALIAMFAATLSVGAARRKQRI